jgi:hypothetical protein
MKMPAIPEHVLVVATVADGGKAVNGNVGMTMMAGRTLWRRIGGICRMQRGLASVETMKGQMSFTGSRRMQRGQARVETAQRGGVGTV